MKKLITTLGILGFILGFTILPTPSASHSWGTAVFAVDCINVDSDGFCYDKQGVAIDQETGKPVNTGLNYTKSAADSFTESLALFFSYMIHGLVYISWMIIGMIGPFLGNDIVFSPSVTPLLHQLWSLVRDLVNIGFVFILIAMAFKMVFSDGDDKLKKALPKFIISLVGVNFSWLGMKLLVDLATVLTIFIFSLPSMVLSQNPDFCGKNLDNNGCYMIKSIKVLRVETTSDGQAKATKNIIDTGASVAAAKTAIDENTSDSLTPAEKQQAKDALDKNVLKDVQDQYVLAYSGNNMLFSKTIRGSKVVAATKVSTDGGTAKPSGVSEEDLKKLSADIPSVLTITLDDTPIKPDSINPTSVAPLIAYNMLHLDLLGKVNITNQNLLQVIVNDLFGIIFAILYAIAFVALFVALVTRVIVAWIVIILSPLYPLSIAAKDFFKGLDGGKIGDMAFNNIFVSVKVAVPLTAGWIFMAAFSQLGYKPGMSNALPSVFTLTFDPQSPLSNLPLLSNILFQIIGVMIMWKGMQWAIKDSEAKSFIESKIYKPMGDLASWTAGLPLKAQVLPGISGGKAGIGSTIAGTLSGIKAKFDEPEDRNARALKEVISGSLAANKTDDTVVKTIGKMEANMEAIKSGIGDKKTTQALEGYLQTKGIDEATLKKITSDPQKYKGFVELMQEKNIIDKGHADTLIGQIHQQAKNSIAAISAPIPAASNTVNVMINGATISVPTADITKTIADKRFTGSLEMAIKSIVEQSKTKEEDLKKLLQQITDEKQRKEIQTLIAADQRVKDAKIKLD